LRAGWDQIVGVELEPEYFDIAVCRVEAELDRLPLFNRSDE